MNKTKSFIDTEKKKTEALKALAALQVPPETYAKYEQLEKYYNSIEGAGKYNGFAQKLSGSLMNKTKALIKENLTALNTQEIEELCMACMMAANMILMRQIAGQEIIQACYKEVFQFLTGNDIMNQI